MDLSEAISFVQPSIVQIERRSDRSPCGTGFFVDRTGLVVTALHVADAIQSGDTIVIQMAYENSEHGRANFMGVGAEVVAVDKQNDLSLLRANPNPFDGPIAPMIRIRTEARVMAIEPRVAILDDSRPRDGEGVAVTGYPLAIPATVTNSGVVASAWVYEKDDGPVRSMLDRYLIDASVNPGNSGGPVFRIADGSVVGVCVAYRQAPLDPNHPIGAQLSQNSGIAIVVPSKYATALLQTALGT